MRRIWFFFIDNITEHAAHATYGRQVLKDIKMPDITYFIVCIVMFYFNIVSHSQTIHYVDFFSICVQAEFKENKSRFHTRKVNPTQFFKLTTLVP